MLTKDEFYAKWSVLHSDAPITGAVAWWLKISYRFGLVATLLRISPNSLTLLGLLSAVMTAVSATSWWAIFFLILSLFFDGIDGSVAIFQRRESSWGATLDSVADRVSEAFWFYTLYIVGTPAWLAVTLWCIAAFQEYARAKLISLGVTEIGIVTPAERPMRASFLLITLILWQLGFSGTVLLSYGFLAVQVVSFYLVIRYARAQLR